MKMTSEKAVKNHRKMWNWIASRYEDFKSCDNRKMFNIDFYKRAYIKDHFGNKSVKNNCFMCEYAEQMYDDPYNFSTCTDYHDYCLLDWGIMESGYMCEAEGSPYLDLIRYFTHNPSTTCKNIDDVIARCREIANLPVKKIVNDSE